MKKLIKVYLQYPWKFPDSPYYKYLIENPQKDIEYLNIEKQKGVITNKKFWWFSNFLKRNIRRWANFLDLSIPNMHLSPKGEYDLIHCAHCLSKNEDKPWIADFEGTWQMFIGKRTRRGIKRVKEILVNKNCRKILPWTEHTKRELLKEFPEIKDKIEKVYPSVPFPDIKKKEHKEINLLFVGRYFYEKGGLHALEVMNRLTKKYDNVRGIIVSDVPKEIIRKYSSNKKIFICGLMPQRKLFEEIFSKSDIFVYPGYSDTFGFSMLEAMSFGLPVVTVDGFARKEIVGEGKTGFVIEMQKGIDRKKIGKKEEKIIENIMGKTEKLIKNKKLRDSMSKNSIEIIKNGKFSIKERNKKLSKIYEEAIKND